MVFQLTLLPNSNGANHTTPGIRIPAGMQATLVMLLAHLRRAVLFLTSSGGVARASLTPATSCHPTGMKTSRLFHRQYR